jgi:rare lipoprotein A
MKPTDLRKLAILMLPLLATACASPQPRGGSWHRPKTTVVPPVAGAPPAPVVDGPPASADIPPDLMNTPEPVPRAEPRSAYGNPKTYTALGKTYTTLDSAHGYRETGLASWYGRKFQGRKTSSGEPFDMFKLTAAHKTLPLPTYARVTNVGNGQSIVVRINDRGPFHSARIIDLSYAAAAKLGMLGGPGMVEIEALTPGEELPPPPPKLTLPPPVPYQPNFLQVAAYSNPANALALREEINKLGITDVEIRAATFNGDPIQRVLVGPFSDMTKMTEIRNQLLAAGLSADAVSR